MVNRVGGSCVVVRTRESRVHDEGRRGIDKVAKTEEPSMDLDDQADEAWLLRCNANSINGAGYILKTAIVTCGTGLQTSAICDAPGRKSR